MLAAFLTTVFFSVSAVCGNRTAKLLGGTEANFWRLCFAAAFLALYAHSLGGALNGLAFPLFLVSGCIGFGVGDLALFQALPRLGSRLSVILTLCLSSPIAAWIEWVWMGTRLTPLEIGCAIVTLSGVAAALAPGKQLQQNGRTLTVGLFFGLLASLCQAIGAVLSRRAFAINLSAGDDLDGITAAYQRILGGIAVSAVVLLVVKRPAFGCAFRKGEEKQQHGAHRSPAATRWREAWPWVLLNALAGPAIGVSCYQWALKTAPSGVVLPIVALTPVVIIPFSYYVEGERPSNSSLIGGITAAAGAVALAWITTQR